MSIGAGIFLAAVGAIFKYAIETDIAGINIDTIGVILMVAGALIALISIFFMISAEDRARRGDGAVVEEERREVRRG